MERGLTLLLLSGPLPTMHVRSWSSTLIGISVLEDGSMTIGFETLLFSVSSFGVVMMSARRRVSVLKIRWGRKGGVLGEPQQHEQKI
jgi:hypothetical protein